MSMISTIKRSYVVEYSMTAFTFDDLRSLLWALRNHCWLMLISGKSYVQAATLYQAHLVALILGLSHGAV